MMAVIDIDRGDERADKRRARAMERRGIFQSLKPYKVIGDTGEMYVDRFVIISDEKGQAQSFHESMAVPYEQWLAEKREEKISNIGI